MVNRIFDHSSYHYAFFRSIKSIEFCMDESTMKNKKTKKEKKKGIEFFDEKWIEVCHGPLGNIWQYLKYVVLHISSMCSFQTIYKLMILCKNMSVCGFSKKVFVAKVGDYIHYINYITEIIYILKLYIIVKEIVSRHFPQSKYGVLVW